VSLILNAADLSDVHWYRSTISHWFHLDAWPIGVLLPTLGKRRLILSCYSGKARGTSAWTEAKWRTPFFFLATSSNSFSVVGFGSDPALLFPPPTSPCFTQRHHFKPAIPLLSLLFILLYFILSLIRRININPHPRFNPLTLFVPTRPSSSPDLFVTGSGWCFGLKNPSAFARHFSIVSSLSPCLPSDVIWFLFHLVWHLRAECIECGSKLDSK
jgi:hypothetical protein